MFLKRPFKLSRFLPVVGLALGAWLALVAVGQERASYAAGGSGLAPFGAKDGIALTSPHSTGGNPLIPWATLEPRNGQYNWSALDSAISAARQAGKRVIPRIYTNWDGHEQATPTWFFNETGGDYYYPSDSARSRGVKSPVPWDGTYKKEFGEFLTALGNRYNGNATIEFVQSNAGGGLYGELYLGNEPAGHTNSAQRDAAIYWVDAWKAAFPSTNLSVMVNYIGGNIGEDVSAHAASKGVFLQQNSPNLSDGAKALFSANDDRTKIVVDADDACTNATGTRFDTLINKVFSYGSEIDYILLCHRSFSDSDTARKLPGVIDRLRSGSVQTPVSAPAPSQPTAPATAFRDDFSSTMAARWFWTNGRGNSAYSLTAVPGHLQVRVPAGSSHDCWGGATTCTRMLRGVSNVDATYETRIDGVNLGSSAQTYGILLWEHYKRYIRLEFWSYNGEVHPAAWTVNGTDSRNALMGPAIELGSSNSLRVTRSGNTFKLEYSTNGGASWQSAGSFNFTIDTNQAGVHVINGMTNPATTANFDYFSVN